MRSTAPRGPVSPRMRATNVRWWIVFLCFVGTAINYIDRANLSVAATSIKTELHLNDTQLGFVLGAFFWTYAVGQLAAGYLVDRYGARLMYAIAVGWWSVFTAATALAHTFIGLLGFRLGLGIGEAGAYPSNAKVVGAWFPVQERALATSIFDSGSRVGAALSLPIVTVIILSFGWRFSFIVTGLLGLVWIAAWVWFYREPRNHALANEAELQYIEAGGAREGDRPQSGSDVTWADLFRYRTIWGMMLGFFCLNFVIYFFITWFPTYLVHARGFSLPKLGSLGTLPALIAIPGGWLGGYVSDRLYRRGWSLTRARKTCLVGGMLCSSVIALAAVAPSAILAIALLSISYASLAFTAASIWSLPSDIAPTSGHVASIGGIQNFASNIAGVVTTSFTGIMLTITSGSFFIPLLVAGAIALVGAFSYGVIVGPIEPLPLLPSRANRVT